MIENNIRNEETRNKILGLAELTSDLMFCYSRPRERFPYEICELSLNNRPYNFDYIKTKVNDPNDVIWQTLNFLAKYNQEEREKIFWCLQGLYSTKNKEIAVRFDEHRIFQFEKLLEMFAEKNGETGKLRKENRIQILECQIYTMDDNPHLQLFIPQYIKDFLYALSLINYYQKSLITLTYTLFNPSNRKPRTIIQKITNINSVCFKIKQCEGTRIEIMQDLTLCEKVLLASLCEINNKNVPALKSILN